MFKKHEIIWTPDKVKNIWDYYASNQHFSDSYFMKMAGEFVVKYITKNINLQNKKILDYGSGPGYLLKHLDRQNIMTHYHALDFSEETIEALKANNKHSSSLKNTYLFDSDLIKTLQESFDVIVSCEVIEHLNDTQLEEYLQNLYTLLKDNGILIITTPNNENLETSKLMCPDCGCVFHKWQHQTSWNPSSLNKAMNRYGFTTLKIETVYFAGLLSRIKFKLLNKKMPNLVYIGKKNHEN